MDRWTELELQRVAHETRIADRTLDACRDVLVNGMSGSEAARKHQMFQSHLSRALKNLKDKQAEFGSLAAAAEASRDSREASTGVLRHMAQEIAKGVLGPGFSTSMAEPGRTYSGPVVVSTNGYIVQKVGRSGILHDKGSFDAVPELGDHVEIEYPVEPGRAKVRPVLEAQRSRQQGLDR